ncbi:hypothetical protein RGQ29_031096 [Quercus rubra]|uniref:mitogen-activated protein kinase kinase kinase n=1 Tax=Quercus rubra TaxID=3512 RepID=A0AAN7EKM7_QUERU|nr:hypothetical protein RGQ29_031096 [Quercus rubra]
MHHLPRFFGHSSKHSKGMDRRKNSRKPKLERRNAVKHIEYDAASSSSSLEESSSFSSSLHTRSLDLSDRTSFRIEGIDGEFDVICKRLGLSGPEDFAIPAAAWEARKIRSSSDLLPRSRLQGLDSPKIEEVKDTAVRTESEAEAVAELICERIVDTVRIVDETELTRSDPAKSSGCRATGGCGGGIKGTRPPVLKPPPGMRLPAIDMACSTWDLLKEFAGDGGSVMAPGGLLSSSSDEEGKDEEEDEEEEEEEEEEKEEDDKGGGEKEVEAAAAAVAGTVNRELLSESSCSFTTNDDDSSSTTTDPTSSISPNGRFRRSIAYWQKGELLGRGSFGSVYEGIADDGFFFAVKEVSLLDQGSQGKQSVYYLEQEISLLSQFEHENIVQYYGTDKDESKLYIFLELVTKGSLQMLYRRYHLRDSQVSAYTRQILHGLKYLHDRKVVHRDIKCANILVDASGSVKLADFGLAKATKLNDVKSCQGTAFWMAPEVVNRKNQGYGLPADIWSLGCTVLEMLTRQIPYAELECFAALFKIGKGEAPPVPKSLSKDAQDFIMQCLKVNPDHRPTAVQLLDHPFVKRPLSTSSGSASPRSLGRRG